MNLILTGLESSECRAWTTFLGDLDNVSIYEGSILDTKSDAIVSPANSFGFMDGGIDGLYLKHFGKELQQRVQKLIQDKHNGELLVGSADIVETGNNTHPFLIVAPTMRVPMKLADSVNPYLAARAIFLLLKNGIFQEGELVGKKISDTVKTIALPGLCTGVGGISFNTCARQVRAAYDDFVLGKRQTPRTWAEASEQHQLLFTDRPKRLQ